MLFVGLVSEHSLQTRKRRRRGFKMVLSTNKKIYSFLCANARVKCACLCSFEKVMLPEMMCFSTKTHLVTSYKAFLIPVKSLRIGKLMSITGPRNLLKCFWLHFENFMCNRSEIIFAEFRRWHITLSSEKIFAGACVRDTWIFQIGKKRITGGSRVHIFSFWFLGWKVVGKIPPSSVVEKVDYRLWVVIMIKKSLHGSVMHLFS